MKTFREYLNEAELTEGNPAVGDIFELEIARDETLIETYIVDVLEDGIVLEADDTMMRILTHVGYLTEDSNMPTARDSISPIHSNVNKDKSANDDLEKNYMDKDLGATPPARPTRNAVDTKPLTEPKDKKDPKDYMVHEEEDDDFYRPPAGYSELDNTMMSVVDTLKNTSSTKNDKTSYGTDWSSTSVARNPQTRSGSYLQTNYQTKDGKDTVNRQNFQQNVSEPWLDYTLNKAKQDSTSMMQEPDGTGSYKSMPQGPMSQFRATTNEAKYQGREVPLGKKMAGDVKKSKVYVRGPKGNVVKVNFGDPNMTIKKSNPARRKSFRARHNCANPGPRWKARYWSCRKW